METSHSHSRILPWSQRHQQISGVVTQSRAVVVQTQIVTHAAALRTARIGLTTPSCSSVGQTLASVSGGIVM